MAGQPAHYVGVRLFGRATRVYELDEDGVAYVLAIPRNDACTWSWEELARGFRLLHLASRGDKG